MRDESERLSSEIRTHVPDKVTKPNPTVFGVTCRSALVSHVARRGRSTVANTTLNIKITTRPHSMQTQRAEPQDTMPTKGSQPGELQKSKKSQNGYGNQ